MIKKIKGKDIPFQLLSFFIPLLCFRFTSSHSLMFDDAAEFALVIKLGSIAHPPGTPSFILAGMIWSKITSLFGMNLVDSLTLFASLSISMSSLLLYKTFKTISANLSVIQNVKTFFICSLCALSFSTAATSWAWGNTVEVYSFQVLTMAVALYGLTKYHFERNNFSLFTAATGLAAGLGNHHLTMILFLPFTPVFFMKNVFVPAARPDTKKKVKLTRDSFFKQFKNVFSLKDFWILTGLTSVMTILFYSWMFYRAQNIYPFMFGRPDTFGELIYHMSGGSYTKNISSTSEMIISSRLPYFLKLTAMQLFVFLPVFIAGIIIILWKKLYTLFSIILFYFLFLFIYQLNNNQWSSTDAYMLLPFFILSIFIFYGSIFYVDKIKIYYFLPILLCIQIVYNLPLNNRRTYPVSESLMKLLDKSAPPNSIILISDWSLVIQYYYYRIAENFRPDLVVLNYDFKFTHYKILPTLYPEFYKLIQPEYDKFVNELLIEHPHQAINTGCDLSTPSLNEAFKNLLHKTEEVAKSQKKYFLTDPRAHYFYSTYKFYSQARYVSGCFSSSLPGDTSANDNFLKMDFPFLKSRMLLTDPSALDKLVDFQAMLDRHIEFYQANNNTDRQANAQNAKDVILRLQRDMKRSMSFAYKL